MATKPHSAWRMAFRSGSQGVDHWEKCFERGGAVIACRRSRDLSNVEKSDFQRQYWGTTLKSSFHKFRYEMEVGDVIYARSGTQIVGKGVVQGPYRYQRGVLGPRVHPMWAHNRKVRWERGFPPIPKNRAPRVFESQQTVLKLEGDRLVELQKAERKERTREPKQAVEEGRQEKREITWRIRNHAIVKQRKDEVGECDVCGFSAASLYHDLKREILLGHHLEPFRGSAGSRKTKPEDIAIVCPNCHQAIHTANPPLTVRQLKKKLQYCWE